VSAGTLDNASHVWRRRTRKRHLTLNLIHMIKFVILKLNPTLHISLLNIHIFEILFKTNLGHLPRIHIHPHKPIPIHPYMNPKQPIHLLIKLQPLIPRRLRQLAIQPITPAMVPTRQNLTIPRTPFFIDNRMRAVPAHVVECIDGALTVFGENEVEAGDVVAQPVTGGFEARRVREEEPAAAEYGAAFEGEHSGGGVP
jgi:hypothetical protein